MASVRYPVHLFAALNRLTRSVRRALQTHYPRFLFGRPLREGEIPVFVYHDVDATDFAADLAFLRDNGYRTLSTDEFVRRFRTQDGGRSVLLTFDDARRNFWEIAFPLLCEFGARATLFVPTYWIGERRTSDGKEQASPGRNMFMTWEELRTCARSGLIDVQSHAHRHALIYTSSRLVCFASPRLLARQDLYDWPMRREGETELLGFPPFGTPIYEAAPLLSASSRVIEDGAAVRACQEAVAGAGGAAFFASRGWALRLWKVHQAFAGRAPGPTRMGEKAFRALVASEFLLSKRLFETELGQAPRYLAYPWMLGSPLSLELAAAAGIRAVFGVGLDFRRARRSEGPVPAFGRF
ncbi:MAG: polysaccharide deacetylase family protein, partial [Thermodesulfobacteriota bacterium]